MKEPRFKVGDVVWVARVESGPRMRTCPVCFGKLKVVVELGDGETRVEVPCEYCKRGFEGPSGQEGYYEFSASPTTFTITGMDIAIGTDGVMKVRYRSGTDSGWSSMDEEDCFATREETLPRCAELVAAQEEEQKAKEGRKVKVNQSYSWNVGYHRTQARELRRRIQYHERCAVLLEAKVPQDPSRKKKASADA